MPPRNPLRTPIHQGIDEALIAVMVDRFYARVRADAVLGPVFDRVIGDSWDGHLSKLRDFWSSVTMMSGRYKGTPFQAHRRIDGLSPALFTRWLRLWRETAEDLCPKDLAQVFVDRAERIARSLQLGLGEPRIVPSGPAAMCPGDLPAAAFAGPAPSAADEA